MIYFDVTKSGTAGHQSGLMRVSARLRDELGPAAVPVVWKAGWCDARSRAPVPLTRVDWLLTPELFCEAERPGLWAFLKAAPCRFAAIFHDAIPLKFPHTTWPQSVARQPEYMKMLASFDRVFAVSAASRTDLVDFWKWQGAEPRNIPTVLVLGADFAAQPRGLPAAVEPDAAPLFLCLGIVEPRKNQLVLLEAAEELRRRGVRFRLEFVGRVNPHFGKPIAQRIKAASRGHADIRHRARLGDSELLQLLRRSRATLFPTLAEGCGLPLLESLWAGVPCLCSDLPVLRENAEGGGCVALPASDAGAWATGLQRMTTDRNWVEMLRKDASKRPLPTWKATADTLREALA